LAWEAEKQKGVWVRCCDSGPYSTGSVSLNLRNSHQNMELTSGGTNQEVGKVPIILRKPSLTAPRR